MNAQEERELALRIRMALASQAQSDLEHYRSAASRLAEQQLDETPLPWQLAMSGAL